MVNSNIILMIAHSLSKIYINPRLTYFYLIQIVSPSKAKSIKILSEKKPFIITSSGRTGTYLLSKILNSTPPNYVVHEPVPNEQYYHAQALMFPDTAKEYLEKFRLREMSYRIQQKNCLRYGEVNSALRRHIVSLKQLAPFFRMIHIIRDGREVVTSILNRKTMTKDDKIYYKIIPPKEYIRFDEWSGMTRFQKVCWMWAYENNFLRENSDLSVRFEDFISTYDYFKEHILKPLELNVSYEVWKQFTDRKANATQGEKMYTYANWTNDEKTFFWDVCGKEMKYFKYTK